MKARPVLIGAAVILAIGTGGLYAYAQSQKPLLQLGVGYAARVACGCRYIGNRPLADCAKDFEPGMEQIRLSENAATKTITASVPLLVSRAATFDPVLGCQPEPLGGRKPNGFPIAALPPLAAILPDSQRPNILKQCSRSVPANGEAGWKPSASDIAALEAKLPAFLATEKVNVTPDDANILPCRLRQNLVS